MTFALDPQLAADTREILRWPLCRVLLMDDCTYPWLILVPARDAVADIHDMSPADRATLIEEIARASAALKTLTGADKINVAAFGNVVKQMHVHVIARFRTDPAWPRPVWGAVPRQSYEAGAQHELTRRLAAILA